VVVFVHCFLIDSILIQIVFVNAYLVSLKWRLLARVTWTVNVECSKKCG